MDILQALTLQSPFQQETSLDDGDMFACRGAAVAATHLRCAQLSCRIWFEWLPTDSNPSDGLSRSGIHDMWTKEQGWCLFDWQLQPTLSLVTDSLVKFTDLWCSEARWEAFNDG